jgi:cation transport ATPase
MSFQEETTHDKLDEVLELVRENNRILRKMHRSMVWSQIFTYVYWMIILGVAGWSYYHFQPYVVKYISTYQSIMESLNSLDAQTRAFPSDIRGILDKV